MQNFEFSNPTKILFGEGQINNISSEIPSNSKVMITYGGGSIKKNGVYDAVMKSLANHEVIEFGGIEANPQYSTLIKAVHLARVEKIDYLLAVGGGSVIDGTKFIAVAINSSEEDLWNLILEKNKLLASSPLPLGTVLTISATGSEMNPFSVISRSETKEKRAFSHPDNYPKFSVLDPKTLFTLPDRQIANGIVDAFSHVAEQYMTYPSNGAIQDRFSEGIMQTLIETAPKLLDEEKKDYAAMSNLMWSATWALNGAISAGVPQDWATHTIAHELTALHGLDHAVTLAIVYPALLTVMKNEKKDKLLQYGSRVWNINEGNEEERVERIIDKTRSFFESVGIKTHLSDYNIGEETIQEIENRFMDRNLKLGENKTVTPLVVRQILEAAL